MSIQVMPYSLLRVCDAKFPDGPQFGAWGPSWGYHLTDKGLWIKGQACQACRGVVQRGEKCACGDERPALGQHGGNDIRAPYGTITLCPGTGHVLRAGWQNPNNKLEGYGFSVMLQLEAKIRLGSGLDFMPIVTIGHLSEIYVREGFTVGRGVPIGLSGNTGNVSPRPTAENPRAGSHVHTQLELPGPFPRQPVPFQWVNS